MKKVWMGTTGLATLAIPLGAVVACGTAAKDTLPKYVSYSGGSTIAGADSYFVTDGGSISDKSFNQSGFEGWEAASRQSDDGQHVLKPTNASKIADSYNAVKTKNGKLIVAMGYNHLTALKRFSEENPSMGFVFIDNTLTADDNGTKKQQGNVVSVVFKTEQAAFLEGIVASARAVAMDSTDPKIGWWGGMNIPSVNSFISGLRQGVDYYNANNDASDKDVKVINAGYVGNFDAGEGKNSATQLINDGAELLLGVAGPQEFDAITAIKDANKNENQVQVIGVDTDMSKQVKPAADSKYVFDSIMKGLKLETQNAVEAVLANPADSKYGFGKVFEATLDHDGVKIADPTKLDAVASTLGKNVSDLRAAAKQATPDLK